MAIGSSPVSADSPKVDLCAVSLNIGLTVDAAGAPLQGAELWHIQHRIGDSLPDTATLLGATDEAGQLSAGTCYIGTVLYCADPPQGIVALRFFVLKDGFGVARLSVPVSAAKLLNEGRIVGGEPCDGSPEWATREDVRTRGYRVRLTATLKAAH
jgi:hypothetical protein